MADGYRLNEPQVAAERFDDEVMLVDLERGSYYSLAGSGAAIFALLELGCGARQVVELLEQRFGPSAAGAAVADFVERLVTEQLVVPATVGEPDLEAARAIVGALPDGITAPALEGYTDMQELLQIDPIHEVNDQFGWPKMKAE
jgi:hypothetical protein